MQKNRLVIADDHEITRIGIKSTVEATGMYEVCGEAGDGHEAIEKVCRLKPDLLILDVGLPHLNGVEVARHIEVETPHTSILIFTEVESERVMLDALRLGVKGFVLKSESTEDLLAGIDIVLHGKTCFAPRITQILVNFAKQNGRPEVLTAREREIVQLVAEGYCTKDVARLLAMSIKTVETHRSNILRKLQVHTTAEVILYAVRNEIVNIQGAPSDIAMLQFPTAPPRVGPLSSRRAVAA